MRAALLALGLGVALTGCAPNIAEFAAIAPQDPPTSLCVRTALGTPWGTQNIRIARTTIANGRVICAEDGLTVESPIQTPGAR